MDTGDKIFAAVGGTTILATAGILLYTWGNDRGRTQAVKDQAKDIEMMRDSFRGMCDEWQSLQRRVNGLEAAEKHLEGKLDTIDRPARSEALQKRAREEIAAEFIRHVKNFANR